jgi:hypothetical protein
MKYITPQLGALSIVPPGIVSLEDGYYKLCGPVDYFGERAIYCSHNLYSRSEAFSRCTLQSHAACASEHCGQLAVNSRGRVLRRWRLQWGSSAALSAATKGLQRVELSRTSGPRGLTAFGAILPIGDPSAEHGIHGEPTCGPGGKRQIWDH